MVVKPMVDSKRQSSVVHPNPYESPRGIAGDVKFHMGKHGWIIVWAICAQVSYYIFIWLFFMAGHMSGQILLNGFLLSVPILCTGSDQFPAFLGRSWMRRLGALVLLMILSVLLVLFICDSMNIASTRELRQLTGVSYGLRFLAVMIVYFCSLIGLAAANRILLQKGTS